MASICELALKQRKSNCTWHRLTATANLGKGQFNDVIKSPIERIHRNNLQTSEEIEQNKIGKFCTEITVLNKSVNTIQNEKNQFKQL